MLYVQRDAQGKIIALSQVSMPDFKEEVEDDSAEVLAFIADIEQDRESLTKTDLGFIRVVEDLIELLISKNYICFTDLPEAAQQKMLQRQELRDAMGPKLDLLSDMDEKEGFI